MNKSLATLLLIGAITLDEYVLGLQLSQKESIPDYWNDYRFHGRKGWDDANNPRYANPDEWVAQSRIDAPGQVDSIDMTDEEVAYRLTHAGKRGTGFTYDGNKWGLGVKQAQLDDMANYIQT